MKNKLILFSLFVLVALLCFPPNAFAVTSSLGCRSGYQLCGGSTCVPKNASCVYMYMGKLYTYREYQLLNKNLDNSNTSPWCHDFKIPLSYFSNTNAQGEVQALQMALQKEGFLKSASAMVEMNKKVYGGETWVAVALFQQKYSADILTPLGLTHGTGNVNTSTLNKLNKLYGCNHLKITEVPPTPSNTGATTAPITATDTTSTQPATQPVTPPATTTPAWCHDFNTNLGYAQHLTAEVTYLHIALQKEGISYSPDLSSSFTSATESAVKQFQQKYGISQTGYVADQTRAELNYLYGCTAVPAPVIVVNHKVCSRQMCVEVAGVGTDGCSTNEDCLPGCGDGTCSNTETDLNCKKDCKDDRVTQTASATAKCQETLPGSAPLAGSILGNGPAWCVETCNQKNMKAQSVPLDLPESKYFKTCCLCQQGDWSSAVKSSDVCQINKAKYGDSVCLTRNKASVEPSVVNVSAATECSNFCKKYGKTMAKDTQIDYADLGTSYIDYSGTSPVNMPGPSCGNRSYYSMRDDHCCSCAGACTPNCSGKTCGDDGCGGTCGACVSSAGASRACVSGRCITDYRVCSAKFYPLQVPNPQPADTIYGCKANPACNYIPDDANNPDAGGTCTFKQTVPENEKIYKKYSSNSVCAIGLTFTPDDPANPDIGTCKKVCSAEGQHVLNSLGCCAGLVENAVSMQCAVIPSCGDGNCNASDYASTYNGYTESNATCPADCKCSPAGSAVSPGSPCCAGLTLINGICSTANCISSGQAHSPVTVPCCTGLIDYNSKCVFPVAGGNCVGAGEYLFQNAGWSNYTDKYGHTGVACCPGLTKGPAIRNGAGTIVNFKYLCINTQPQNTTLQCSDWNTCSSSGQQIRACRNPVTNVTTFEYQNCSTAQ